MLIKQLIFQQYITFVHFLYDGEIKKGFLDCRSIDINRTNTKNLRKYWKAVADENELNSRMHVGRACDGAASLIEKNESLSQNLLAKNLA